MGTSPAALLIKLEPGVEVAAGSVRGLGKEVPALVAAGWLVARKDGRTLHVVLTDAGVAERATAVAAAAAAASAKPARRAATGATATRGGKAATATARLAALEQAVAALTARVAALETHAPAAVDPVALRAAVIEAIGDIDARTRAGGLVPIPELRAELRRRNLAASDADVTATLEELERSWVIDLSVAQDPSLVSDRAAGIERSGRGLLYYVARR